MSGTVKEIDFMKVRVPMICLSLALVVASIIAIAVKGFNFGLDFTGGTLVEVEYAQAPAVSDVREQLERSGFSNMVVQKFGTDTNLLVRMQEGGEQVGDRVVQALRAGGAEVQLKRVEFVGAQVGDELREKGGIAMLAALGAMLLYVAFRFQFKFGVGALVALLHDAVVTLGAFALFQWDFDLTVLAAVMAMIGYSLNDTIVIFDRIRENFRKIRKATPEQVINISISQTLVRTLVTSGTTLLVVISLFLFGGEAVHYFSMALIVGIVVGTYSSIYVATGLALAMGASKEDFMLPVKEDNEADARP